MSELISLLFDTTGFPPRWSCGLFTERHGMTHIVADLATFVAYAAIPCVIAYYVRRKRVDFPRIFWLFALFIFACGTVHLIEAMLWWWPVYRLSALTKVVTAGASIATVVALFPALPVAIRLPDRARLADNLERSERRLRSLVEVTESAVFTLNAGFGMVEPQPSWEEMTGQEASRNQGLGWLEAVQASDQRALRQRIDAAIERGEGFEIRVAIRSARHGGHRRGDLRFAPVSGSIEAPAEWIGAFRDRQEELELEGQLARADALAMAAIRAMPTGLVLVDGDGTIVMANEPMARMFRVERDALEGSKVDTLVPSDARALHAKHRADYLRTPVTRQMGRGRDLSASRPDGSELPVEISLNPVDFQEESLVLATVVDITERKAAEERIRRSNYALELRNREMEELLYTMSHDLRSPLVTVRGFADLADATSDAGDVDETRLALTRVQKGVDDMAALIDGLLEVSRAGRVSSSGEWIDMAALIEKLREHLAPELSEAGLRLEVVSELPATMGDEEAIERAFTELVRNAMEHARPTSRPVVEIGFRQEEAGGRFFVRDFGPGVDRGMEESVFRLFETTAGRSGKGVGLAIVGRIARAHEGTAGVERAPDGEGARFWVSFGERGGELSLPS